MTTDTNRRGPIASIGYVGWATLGGYGPLAGKYGLGADQIVKAQYVNAQGNLVEANDAALRVIRGGGGTLGILTELTIKTYPLKKASSFKVNRYHILTGPL